MELSQDPTRSGIDADFDPQMFGFDEPCPYLPGRTASLRGFFASPLDASLYRMLLDHGMRRSGDFFYKPHCRGCNQCISLRVPVAEYRATRSQRRCWACNSRVMVEVGRPMLTDEKFDLYNHYQKQKHSHSEEKDMGALQGFLYNPVVDTLEFTYRDPGGKLLAVGICDVFVDAISSVYCYYDPEDARRGLGTFTALYELEYARQQSLAYYYMGYWVTGCQAMRYKASYRPHDLLMNDGQWIRATQKDLPEPADRTTLGQTD